MISFEEGIEFDPGFTMHLSLISREVESFYYTINSYPKFAQKKQMFKAYSTKLWKLAERNIGFYAACILWAGVAKRHKDKLILNNICYGGEYVEQDNISEIIFMRALFEQYKKDMKYYCGQEFEIPKLYRTILDDYEEFTKINEGFINVSKADDLKLPKTLKDISDTQESELMEKFNKVVDDGNFKPLIEYYTQVK